MFKVTNEEIDDLVNKEYENAVVEHGETYNTDHEFYAVLKEEIEEVKFYIECLEENFNRLWKNIKDDNDIFDDTEGMEADLEESIKESLQCLAVIKKYKNKQL